MLWLVECIAVGWWIGFLISDYAYIGKQLFYKIWWLKSTLEWSRLIHVVSTWYSSTDKWRVRYRYRYYMKSCRSTTLDLLLNAACLKKPTLTALFVLHNIFLKQYDNDSCFFFLSRNPAPEGPGFTCINSIQYGEERIISEWTELFIWSVLYMHKHVNEIMNQ